jgi:dTDP-4-amino-4,6-dideoxygalactose transaminase
LDDMLARRERVAGWYGERLARIDGVTPPVAAPWTTRTSWFVYVIRVDDRDHVIDALAARGVPARAYFPPIHLQPFYRESFGFRVGDFPVAEEAGARCLALPFFSTMRADEVDLVCGALAEVLASSPRRALA